MSADALKQLAESYGIELSYYEDNGRYHEATPESLLAVLRVLGSPVEKAADAGDALRERRLGQWRRPLEPVQVVWDGQGGEASLRLPAQDVAGSLGCRLEFENGESRFWTVGVGELHLREEATAEGTLFARLGLPLPLMPLGYHRLTVQAAGRTAEGLVLAAPTRAYAPPEEYARTWGLFLPLYAVRTRRDWGAGDFTDLEDLIGWVQRRGGGLVGTLPLLAAFLGEGTGDGGLFEPSPYAPASRLFWNEFYVDVDRAYRDAGLPPPSGDTLRRERDELRALEFVEYGRLMALKRRYLEDLARAVFSGPGPRRAEFETFAADRPRLRDYAAFRATCERRRESWWVWPERLREGTLHEADYDADAARYHAFVQWLADRQLRDLSEKAGAGGPGLYLDLPLGVNSDSYDVWRERPAFALGASGGAPPDSFFTKGQEWGFPPLHPENIRAQGYGYLRDTLRNHMQYAGLLRVDHVMGLHRLFFVPHGLGAMNGVYVRYRPEEMYAVFSLESNRHRCVLAGEDLGTVPDPVRPAMARHEVHRLYVGQYEMRPGKDPIQPAPEGAIASLNTHDMPTFTAYWHCLDLEDRQELGILTEETVRWEAGQREAIRGSVIDWLRRAGLLGQATEPLDVLRGFLCNLARMPVSAVLVNAEDLWQATKPQNVPGTWRERPNWRRRAAYALEDYERLPGLPDLLAALNAAVRGR
jgi:4-alpha-glucanotransferase